MAGASIETTLELWATSLRDVKARMRSLFTQDRVAASANLFLDGLLAQDGLDARRSGGRSGSLATTGHSGSREMGR